MARVYMYVIISVGIMLTLQVLGIQTGINGLAEIVNVVTSGEDITVSDFFDSLFDIDNGILLASLGVGLIAGLFARAQLENLIVLPFITGTLVAFIGTFIRLIGHMNNLDLWLSNIILIVMGMFTIGFIVSLVEFFRGNV